MTPSFVLLAAAVSALACAGDALATPEPGPPGIPQPEPEPRPMPVPQPEPIREPFPDESDAEKIQRLTRENAALESENAELESENAALGQEIAKLRQIISEQLGVILHLLDQIKQAVFMTGGAQGSA